MLLNEHKWIQMDTMDISLLTHFDLASQFRAQVELSSNLSVSRISIIALIESRSQLCHWSPLWTASCVRRGCWHTQRWTLSEIRHSFVDQYFWFQKEQKNTQRSPMEFSSESLEDRSNKMVWMSSRNNPLLGRFFGDQFSLPCWTSESLELTRLMA